MEAQKLLEEAQNLEKAWKYAEAVPLAERALELRESVLGRTHPEVASCLNLLGDIHRLQGSHARAESLLQRALAIREAALGQSHPDVATSLHTLAVLYTVQGFHARAEPLYERALAIREAALGKGHPDVARSLNALATLYEAQGLYVRAEPLYERALAIREAALGKDHPDVAGSLNSLAGLYETQGLYARAESLYEHALTIYEAALGKSHPDVARPLNNLAILYARQGHYARAEPLLERVLMIWETALGKSHSHVAYALNNLASLYMEQGIHSRAEPLYERALAIYEAVLGKHHPDVALSLNNLAVLYMDQGFYARAESFSERALAIYEAVFGKEHPSVGHSLEHLANIYYEQALYAQAEPLYERALAIYEAALGKHHPDIATALNNLANLYMEQGLYARAEPLHERALSIREAAFGKNHRLVADSLNNLAYLSFLEGHYARAEPLYERALAIREAIFGKSHPHVAQLLNNLAQLRLAQQNLVAALPLFTRAFAASEEHLRQQVFSFSEARLTGLLDLLREDEERLYSLARAYPDDARVRHLALSAALLRKGRSVEELADTSRIIFHSLGQADHEDFERLRALRTQLSTLSLSDPGPLSPADYQQRIKELTDKANAIEEDLSMRSVPLRALSALPPPDEVIYRVAKTLPQDSALIEFIAYRDSPLVPTPGTPASQSPSPLNYLALVLFADGRTDAIDLGPAEPIDAAALRLHGALARNSASYHPAARALYKLAFRPLVPHMGQLKRLFIAPDSQLALVPFAALHDGNRFLVDALDITYLTSGKDLLPRPENLSPARSVVVLAAPEFYSPLAISPVATQAAPALAARSASLERFFSSLRSDLADWPWPPLPGTRKEAEAIQRLIPHAQILLGPAATKQALLTVETPGILHVATHGFFIEDAATPAASRAVKHFGATGDAGPRQRLPDPLLRSGLVLAGARAPAAQPGSLGREDALVTALELAGLDLWGTQLVVLSACDAGRGDVKLGQGIYGLRRALVVAGAESLVTSLWKINDETTHELMEGYYRKLLAGEGRAAALRQTMRALRQKHPHPYFWAPFILIGNDAPLQELAPSISARPVL